MGKYLSCCSMGNTIGAYTTYTINVHIHKQHSIHTTQTLTEKGQAKEGGRQGRKRGGGAQTKEKERRGREG